MNMDEIATRNSAKTLPLPAQRAKLNVERAFTEDEFVRLARGRISRDMDDKWFIFMEEDVLFFHRSWSGVCIYEVHFDPRHAVTDVWVNREAQQYNASDNEYDQQMLNFLIDNLLLGRSTAFPMPSNLPSGVPQGLFQHNVSGTGYPEKQDQRKETFITKVKRIFKSKGH
jgi:hypothetical protein